MIVECNCSPLNGLKATVFMQAHVNPLALSAHVCQTIVSSIKAKLILLK